MSSLAVQDRCVVYFECPSKQEPLEVPGFRSGRLLSKDNSVQCSSVIFVDSMSHCVPDWDGHGGELDAIIASTDYLPPVKGRLGSLPPKRSPSFDLASLHSSDVSSVWAENGSVATKPQGSGGKNPDWQAIPLNVRRQETEDAVTPSKPATSEPLKDGILAMTVPVVDTMNSTLLVDDEMVSWLQYPLDDSLEKNYCSDFFGELPNSTDNSMQAIKDSLAVGQSSVGRNNCRNMPPVNGGKTVPLNRVVSADAAMAMGAGRAAGVLPQAGVEAFTQVRTQQPYSGKWSPNSSSSPTKTLGAAPPSLSYGQRTPPLIPNISTSLCPPPKTYPVPLQPAIARKGTMNFSHFSVPAVNMKANLQYLGVSHNVPAQNRMKTSYLPTIPNAGSRPFDTCTSSGSSIAESTTTGMHSEGSRIELHVAASEGQQPATVATESNWPTSIRDPLPPSSKNAQEPATNSTMAGNNHVDSESRPADVENRQNCTSSVDTSITSQGTDKCVARVPELPELPEPTLTSSSGGSGNSGKGGANRGKRRRRDPEESEAQSDDAEEEVIEKKPQQRSSTTKRTRAAEVHNLSERRRRDRINEKMKALQELIPNSNKADKASMLDEAIEYLKMLQIQLQMMSMRSGMSIPPIIPSSMQHLQVNGMGGMPHMGMGMGMGLGMGMGQMVGMGGHMGMGPMVGMGAMDMNSLTGRTSHLIPHLSHGGAPHSGSPMMPHPSHGGASYNVSQVMTHSSHGGSSHNISATSPAVSMVDNDLRLQSNRALESAYLARQHPLQLTPQTMDVYNAYMLHQQQQQQQHQQHHQLHHLPSNMGGGGL